jgi:hypothetical protein
MIVLIAVLVAGATIFFMFVFALSSRQDFKRLRRAAEYRAREESARLRHTY